jgi:hypothetical protein
MAIPAWNEYGILPEGVHDCQIEEMGERLGFSPHRLHLVAGLNNALGWMAGLPPIQSLIVDGSFVTDKDAPRDIDVVAIISNLSEQHQREWISAWMPEKDRLKRELAIDLYPTVHGQGNDFSAFFQYLRPQEALDRGAPLGVKKGVLRIVQ